MSKARNKKNQVPDQQLSMDFTAVVSEVKKKPEAKIIHLDPRQEIYKSILNRR